MTNSFEPADWQVDEPRQLLETPIGTITAGRLFHRIRQKERTFYRLEAPDWVNIIARTPSAEIVLIRQFRYGSRQMEVEIPGGAVDPGETPEVAGARELLEETGFAGDPPLMLGWVQPNPALQNNRCFTVLIDQARQITPPAFDEMEDISSFLIHEAEIFKAVATQPITHGLVLNALHWFRLWREESSH
jgi:8-oxo-dGTP pyrophosphatase MutT (NUDIX family)